MYSGRNTRKTYGYEGTYGGSTDSLYPAIDEFLEDKRFTDTEKYYSRTYKASWANINAAVSDYHASIEWD